jgi:hypothetical protein
MRRRTARLFRRLALAQTLVDGLPQQVGVGPGEIFHFGDQFGPSEALTAHLGLPLEPIPNLVPR